MSWLSKIQESLKVGGFEGIRDHLPRTAQGSGVDPAEIDHYQLIALR